MKCCGLLLLKETGYRGRCSTILYKGDKVTIATALLSCTPNPSEEGLIFHGANSFFLE